jgi:predicted nucleotidyltransferase
VAELDILAKIRLYLETVQRLGIPVARAVLFGSRARGTADEWSDIDLVVVSPVFDGPTGPAAVDTLWRACAATGGYIEPVACGVKRWEEDDGSPLLAIARTEGIDVLGAASLPGPSPRA